MSEQEKRYYSTADIVEILSCSKSYANQLMAMFEKRGQLLRVGRFRRVSVQVFNDWTASQTKEAQEEVQHGNA